MSPVEAWSWRQEYETLSARWDALRTALRAEGDSVLLRQRLQRVEALMATLTGDVEALSR